MTQIVFRAESEDIALPETSKDKYQCGEEILGVQIDMINGRRVIEERGRIWKVSYSYDYMGNDLLRQVLAVLRSGAPIYAAVLPDNSDEMISSYFVVESLAPPTMAFSRKDNAYWHNISFVLREEEPHG